MANDGGGEPQRRPGLPREARIRERREFLAVQGAGVRFNTRHFIVFLRPGDRGPRLGITASRRVGGAVVRNRWKRVLREAFRHLRAQSDRSFDAVVIARAGEPPPSLDEAAGELREVLQRWRGGARGGGSSRPRRS